LGCVIDSSDWTQLIAGHLERGDRRKVFRKVWKFVGLAPLHCTELVLWFWRCCILCATGRFVSCCSKNRASEKCICTSYHCINHWWKVLFSKYLGLPTLRQVPSEGCVHSAEKQWTSQICLPVSHAKKQTRFPGHSVLCNAVCTDDSPVLWTFTYWLPAVPNLYPCRISTKKAIGGGDIPGDVFRLLGEDGLRIINHNRLTAYMKVESCLRMSLKLQCLPYKNAKSHKMQRPSHIQQR